VLREGVSISSIETGSNIALMLKIFAAGVVAALVFLFPFAGATLVAVWPQRKQFPVYTVQTFMFAAGALGAGAAAWGLLNTALNAVQLMSVCSGFLTVAAAVWIGQMSQVKSKPVFIARIVVLLLLISGCADTVFTVNHHRKLMKAGAVSENFLQQLRHYTEYENAVGFICSQQQYQNPFYCYPHFSVPCPELLSAAPYAVPVGLGEMSRAPSSEKQTEAQCLAGVRLGLLYNYSHRINNSLQPGERLDSLALQQFCKTFQIHCVIVARDAVIASELGDYDVIITDEKTGLRLLRLK
ncbi:MAG: hypothetical protein ACRC3B_13995, partial [Bacteroidia bacterium]